MSIEVELNRKAGRVCKDALAGKTHCPLIVRTSSEDVLVGNVFGMLRHIRPHLWLGPMLNAALDTDEFRQVWYKDLSIRLWERQPAFPSELLGFKEGRTEPDIIIEWENPPTTVWIEAKYHAPMAESTANSPNNNQATRGIRNLLYAAGHIQPPSRLFDRPRRRPIWLALLKDAEGTTDMDADNGSNSTDTGGITWDQLRRLLNDQERFLSPIEVSMSERLTTYLDSKMRFVSIA